MGELEHALPSEVISASTQFGNELLLPLNEATQAITIANQNSIAVLGVEIFNILPNGIQVETYSGYDHAFGGTWTEYVRINNVAALNFIEKNVFGNGYRYILTDVSETEFKELS